MIDRRTVAALCAAAYLCMGIASSVLGPTLANLTAAINLPLAEAGVLRAALQVGSFSATLGAGYLLARGRTYPMLMAAMAFIGVGLLGMIATGQIAVTVLGALLIGIGTGFLDMAASVAIGTLYHAKSAPVFVVAHTCFGIGFFTGPLIAAQALQTPGHWPIAYLVPAVASGFLTLVFGWLTLTARLRPAESTLPTGQPAARPAIHWLPLLPLILLTFLYSGAGSGVADWTATHVRLVVGASATTASQVTSLYGLALTVGRMSSIFTLRRFGELPVMTVGIGLATFGAAVILAAGGSVQGVALGVAVVGFGFSPIYATALAMAGQHQPEHRARVTAILLAGSAIGGSILPVVQGWIGGGHSGGMVVTLVASLGMLIAVFALRWVNRASALVVGD